MIVAVTAAAANYLPNIRALAESVKRTNPDIAMVACLVERELSPVLERDPNIDLAIRAEDLGIANFDNFMFSYNVMEGCTAIKADLFRFLLERFPEADKFIFLDPDILVLGPMSELAESLDHYNLSLTPHLDLASRTPGEIQRYELSVVSPVGVFNTGVLALRRGPETDAFLEWWGQRLELFAHMNGPNQEFADQKWLNFAPAYFEGVHSFRDPCYNVSFWNFAERGLTLDENDRPLVGGQPVKLFHFSRIRVGDWDKYASSRDEAGRAARRMIALYGRKLAEYDFSGLEKTPWSYDSFKDGSPILPSHRIFYTSLKRDGVIFDDPYDRNAKESFYDFYLRRASGIMGASIRSGLTSLQGELRSLARTIVWLLWRGARAAHRPLVNSVAQSPDVKPRDLG